MKYLAGAFLLLIALLAGCAWTYAYSGAEQVTAGSSNLEMLDAFTVHTHPGDVVGIDRTL
jgi:hypothetical protein